MSNSSPTVFKGPDRCPYLVKGYLFACTSDEVPYIPSLARLRKFCEKIHHIGCPYFMGQKKQGMIFHFGLWEE